MVAKATSVRKAAKAVKKRTRKSTTVRKAAKKVAAKKTSKAAPKGRKTLASAQKELDDFKKKVIDETAAFPSGCSAGKNKFLQQVRLIPDTLSGTYRVVLDFPVDRYSLNDDDIDDMDRYFREWLNDGAYGIDDNVNPTIVSIGRIGDL